MYNLPFSLSKKKNKQVANPVNNRESVTADFMGFKKIIYIMNNHHHKCDTK
jgi:hypothetical protein